MIRIATENPAWGHRRVQGELVRPGPRVDRLLIVNEHHLRAPQVSTRPVQQLDEVALRVGDECHPHPGLRRRPAVPRRGVDHSAAFAAWGPIVVELAQVHAIDERLAAAYRVAPGAVSHVSWVVPDVAKESRRLSGLGCAPINTARTGPISVAWHDGGPLFPHPIEVHQDNEVVAGMHQRLCALRADGGH